MASCSRTISLVQRYSVHILGLHRLRELRSFICSRCENEGGERKDVTILRKERLPHLLKQDVHDVPGIALAFFFAIITVAFGVGAHSKTGNRRDKRADIRGDLHFSECPVMAGTTVT
ncbi:MAG: hypothetical protein BJ554DRAFT_1839 [Olpidium bornovanus]|uniref:Uncharacterized protein n=1 Tax=Olpidium bornovanus TaxID=278681 RepID=A0A8H7ZQZ3_9FUNG|nr:MAG: hypothetical protein BJ554DRAFT_1839 [Olpidium bornovanus]